MNTSVRVLIVDDTLAMRTTIRSIMVKLGFADVIDAVNGLDAWAKLTASDVPVGLILSDQNMPECTGIEFLKKVRADAKFANLPFVMVTSEGDRTFLLEALKAGASDIAIKPVTADLMKEKITRAMAKAAG